MKTLAELLANVPHTVIAGSTDVAVRSVVADSRRVQAGDVYVCLPGYRAEGGEMRADRHEFIPEALKRGATALAIEHESEAIIPPGITVIQVVDAWAAIAAMADAFYDHPSHALTVIGVTGTSGKTSTTYFIEAVLQAAGRRCARLGTIEYRFGRETFPATQTTPEAPELQSLLRHALDVGCDSVAMEVSSHALALQRVGSVAFDIGVFTNLSQDHLNFHATMDDYLQAKGRLFEMLGTSGKSSTAVINADDPQSSYIRSVNRSALLSFGRNPGADVRAVDIHTDRSGTRFTALTPNGPIPVTLSHLGEFHVYNALAAVAAGQVLKVGAEAIQTGLANTPGVPGRLEPVQCGQDFGVAVDYAHKPDALKRLLESVRRLTVGRVLTVFGCGGDRDRGKRPIMGQIAAELSDLVIVTSDNPRTEEPERIIADILEGARTAAEPHRLLVEPDRARAIQLAIAEAEPGDFVVIAGKGHETTQTFADHRIDFDDRKVARAALLARNAHTPV